MAKKDNKNASHGREYIKIKNNKRGTSKYY